MNNTTKSTTAPSTNNKQARNHRRRNLLIAASALTVLAFTSCSAADRREFGEIDIHDSLASHVERAVNDVSLSLSDSLDCTSSIDLDSHVSASCVGTASSGQAVSASYAGTADVDAETCSAVLVVTIADHQIIDQPYVQCFDSA